MEKDSKYMAEFYLSDREIRISGPVDFVKDQMQSTKNVIDLFAERIKQRLVVPAEENKKTLSYKDDAVAALPPSKGEEYVDFEEVKDAEFSNKYSNIIARDGDKIQVLSKIPGNSMGARMVNLVLIYLLAKLKMQSIEKVPSSELRAVCEFHGELDGAHFALYMKNKKKWFLLDGNSKSNSVKITLPGMKEAERLLDSMKN